MESNDEERYDVCAIKTCRHLAIAIKDLLQNEFKLPNDKVKLYELLNNFKLNVGRRLRGVISTHQWEKLCPANGETDITQLDVTALAIIYRNIEHIIPGFDDELQELKEKYQHWIDQACKDRNKFLHPPQHEMSEEEFESLMESIEKTLRGINYSRMEDFKEAKELWVFHGSLIEALRLSKEAFDANFENMFEKGIFFSYN